MTPDKDIIHDVVAACNRRSFLRRATLASAAATVLPTAVSSLFAASAAEAKTPSPTLDVNILNFALNLEYLEAEYYAYATTGTGLASEGIDLSGGDGTAAGVITIKSSPAVPFTKSTVQSYAMELAADEKEHVLFLRSALAAAGNLQVAEPNIDLLNSFNKLSNAAGLGATFDPFANDTNFLIGGFIFEDVGATAYHGAAPLIYSKAYLKAAAGILAVEGYHAGLIRSTLYALGVQNNDTSIASMVQAISNTRAALGEPDGADKDQGIVLNGSANIVPTDDNGLIFARKTTEVLRIVYGNTSATPGGFFPNGMNGAIK